MCISDNFLNHGKVNLVSGGQWDNDMVIEKIARMKTQGGESSKVKSLWPLVWLGVGESDRGRGSLRREREGEGEKQLGNESGDLEAKLTSWARCGVGAFSCYLWFWHIGADALVRRNVQFDISR